LYLFTAATTRETFQAREDHMDEDKSPRFRCLGGSSNALVELRELPLDFSGKLRLGSAQDMICFTGRRDGSLGRWEALSSRAIVMRLPLLRQGNSMGLILEARSSTLFLLSP
jgi:hypothetical protein